MERVAISRWPRLRRQSAWLAFAFAVAVLVFDWLRPVNGAIAMLYVLPTAIALGSRRQEALINIGLACVAFTVLGYFAGPQVGVVADELLQRGCAIVALGLISWVGWQLVESVETAEQLRVDSCLRQVAEEAATFFRSMVDHVPIGISRTDLSGRFVFVNEAFCQMVGVTADDLLGELPQDAAPDLSSEELSGIHSRTDVQAPSEQIVRSTSQGGERFMKVIRTPVKEASGRIVGSQTVWLDVTELKQAQHVLERNAQNLERSNVDLQQFAYVASHDLQEPLRAVSSYCQLLEKHYSPQLDERGLRWLQFIVNGARRMQTLVRDLLTYARIDNKAESWLTVDSGQACRQALENLAQTIEETHANVTVGKLPVVWADATQMEVLFQNLIANAVKFRGDQPPKVSITATRVGSDWQFAVKDNGIGIKPEFHERVFEIFKRLQSQESYPGTGIGLAICKRIVQRFGGRIWVESELGRGSTFFFTVPHPPTTPEVDHASN